MKEQKNKGGKKGQDGLEEKTPRRGKQRQDEFKERRCNNKMEFELDKISLYLTLFECQIQRADIVTKFWMSYLVGLLPNNIDQILAREDKEIGGD
ncbi:hypothetical protein CEXT_777261 [Caerostris extrusa]|uniref:Uncharacterized protein n=1 Tax=Caerostris extrusa TaxID=172846 RepID=A0AAV4V6U6_CAEEX|nr:hypothetical protein CEXT_777261 [Caerostris extrusa]